MRSDLSILLPLLLAIAFTVVSCKSTGPDQPPVPPAPVPPAQYGDPNGTGTPVDPNAGRFGYPGTDPNVPAAGTTPAPAPSTSDGMRDVRDIAPSTSAPKPQEETKPTPPAPSAPSSSEMPYAIPVPGNPLAVTLPGANASLGAISIEKYDSAKKPTGEPLKRGTQVQIPDPNNPGKKIYFKVP